jgi:uncharacterized protein
VIDLLQSLPSRLLCALIRAYRYLFSPLVGMHCRFYPSCSAYGLTALEQHGAVRGTALIAWRIARCNPWCEGGIDEPPPEGVPFAKLFRRGCVCAVPPNSNQ